MLTTGAGKTAKEVTVQVTPTTVLRRYAADSVDFARASVAPITAIQVGDQLRALLETGGSETGAAAGQEQVAREVVSGSFRNLSGRISGVNVKDGTVSLRDLMTKKNVTVRIVPTTQMKRLSDEQAGRIAAMMNGAAAGARPGAAAGSGAGPWQRPDASGAGSRR